MKLKILALGIILCVATFICSANGEYLNGIKEQPPTIQHTTMEIGGKQHAIYVLTYPVLLGPPQYQQQALFVLHHAQKGNICVFRLSGYGGSVESMNELLAAMHTTECFVIVKVLGNVYSAYSLLATGGDQMTVEPGLTFMFHEAYLMINGKPTPMSPEETLIDQENDQRLLVSRGLLTDKEFDIIYANWHNQVYITGEEMLRRFHQLHDVPRFNPFNY